MSPLEKVLIVFLCLPEFGVGDNEHLQKAIALHSYYGVLLTSRLGNGDVDA